MPEAGVPINADRTGGAAAPSHARLHVFAWAAVVSLPIVAVSMLLHPVPRESWPNNLVDEATWKATLSLVPMAKIGAVWTVIVSLTLRRSLRVAFADLKLTRRHRR